MSTTSTMSMASVVGAGRILGIAQIVHSSYGQVLVPVSGMNMKNVSSLHRTGTPLKSTTQNFQKQQVQRRFVVSASTFGGKELYQPFRPPQTKVEDAPAGARNVEEMLQVLRDKEGLWYNYAGVLPALNRSGFSPSEIDEATGINGHEQNQLVVGSQVRASLIATGFDQQAISWFDNGGAEILYELRTLSIQQRRASAEFIMGRNMDGKGARDLAKAVKDFERRRNVKGWENFTSSPGDCMALSLLRQSKDARSPNEVETFLNQALEYVETEKARKLIENILRSEEPESVDEKVAMAQLTIMRLSSEELPVVLPVCEFTVQSVTDCPSSGAGSGGPFSIHNSSGAWRAFVEIPGWKPISDATAPVAIQIQDSKLLPKQVGVKNNTDPILLVIDKGNRTVDASCYFLVNEGESMNLKAGAAISGTSCTVLGRVLIALRPPFPEDPNEEETSWE